MSDRSGTTMLAQFQTASIQTIQVVESFRAAKSVSTLPDLSAELLIGLVSQQV